MSKTPFEIRLQLLEMAKDMLATNYHNQTNIILTDWGNNVAKSLENKEELPAKPVLPSFPTEEEIIQKATKLNAFVSNS